MVVETDGDDGGEVESDGEVEDLELDAPVPGICLEDVCETARREIWTGELERDFPAFIRRSAASARTYPRTYADCAAGRHAELATLLRSVKDGVPPSERMFRSLL